MSAIGSAAYLAYAAAALAAAGTYVSSQNAAASERRAAEAEDYNAKVTKMAAENSMAAASANEDAKRRENAMKIGAQKSALLESGMDISSGSGADLVEQSVLNTELDALNIRYQGKLQAAGYTNQSALSTMNAENHRANAKAATGTAMYLGMASSALTSGSSGYMSGRRTT